MNSDHQISALAKILQRQPVTVITGAGISAGSGLPVYRDASGNWIHKQPVRGPKFRSCETTRQRYWCRSYFGWPQFSKAKPNNSHNNLVTLEQNQLVSSVITQNVDGLHQAAGSKSTIALHGNLSDVICLKCGDVSQRTELQTRLTECNPEFLKIQFKAAPDGDAIVDDCHIQKFKTVDCLKCAGLLQPHVVFYGDNVPKQRVDHCMDCVLNSRALLCIATSLMVFSSYRFCKAAHQAGIPIAILNNGVTRADEIATLKINADCNHALRRLKAQLL